MKTIPSWGSIIPSYEFIPFLKEHHFSLWTWKGIQHCTIAWILESCIWLTLYSPITTPSLVIIEIVGGFSLGSMVSYASSWTDIQGAHITIEGVRYPIHAISSGLKTLTWCVSLRSKVLGWSLLFPSLDYSQVHENYHDFYDLSMEP